MTETNPQLDYAPPLPLRRRKVFRRAMLALGLLVLIITCWIMLPRYWRNAQAVMEQRKWMAYTRPDTRIAFEPPGAKGTELWRPGQGYVMRPGGIFHETGLSGLFANALFVHARRRPDGQKRLVWVSLGYESTKPLRFRLEFDGVIPATIGRPARRLPHTPADPLPVDAAGKPPRLYAGQPDPNDESHFTIRYEFEAEGRGGVIHGWLRDDDTIDFEINEGPSTTQADKN
jgi:hypothetical protein